MDYSFELSSRLLPANPVYSSREGRNKFASSFIQKHLSMPQNPSILNVGGGGKRHLSSSLPPRFSVFELDLGGDCDLIFDLDSGNPIPLEDSSFPLVCALDVLEHLESFHFITNELMRISSRFILISLPLPQSDLLNSLFNSSIPLQSMAYGVHSKYYGLPIESGVDRHRWHLTADDVIRYFVNLESLGNCKVKFIVPSYGKSIKTRIFRCFFGPDKSRNFLLPWIWVLVEKLPG